MKNKHFASRLDTLPNERGTFDAVEARALLEAKLLEGLQTPESQLMPAQWQAVRREALRLIGTRKAKC